MNETNPEGQKLVTCNCQNCNGHIQFDASGFSLNETRTAECPHCHLETILFVPRLPHAAVPADSPPLRIESKGAPGGSAAKASRNYEWIIAFASALLISLVMIVMNSKLTLYLFPKLGTGAAVLSVWLITFLFLQILRLYFCLTVLYLGVRWVLLKIRPTLAKPGRASWWRIGMIAAATLLCIGIRGGFKNIPLVISMLRYSADAAELAPPAKPAQPITGAFGFVLGERLADDLHSDVKSGRFGPVLSFGGDSTYLEEEVKRLDDNARSGLVSILGVTNFPPFENITLCVLIDRRIYEIWGQTLGTVRYEAEEQIEHALTLKYGPGARSKNSLRWGDSARELSFEWSDKWNDLKVRYIDKDLEKLKGEEHEREQEENAKKLSNHL